MPVYKKGKKWRVAIWVRNTRRDFILSGTKAEAERYEAIKRVELQASAHADALTRNAPSFFEFSKGAYKVHAETQLKKSTLKNRFYTLATLSDHFKTLKMSEIKLKHVEAYKAERIKAKIRPSTINDELKVFRTVLNYAREIGIQVANVEPKNLPMRGVKRRVTFWTGAQVQSLLAAVASDPTDDLFGLVVFLLNTGCRKGEALAMRWKNIDLDRGLVRVEPSEEWQPKDGEAREIPISGQLLPFLVNPGDDEEFVFCNRSNERFVFWPQRAFDRSRAAAGWDDTCDKCSSKKTPPRVACSKHGIVGGPHACRHTFASHFLAGRPDLYLLAKILGHSASHVTELYAHLLPDHLERARNVVSFGLSVGHGLGTDSSEKAGFSRSNGAR